jgi:hypothetical protein
LLINGIRRVYMATAIIEKAVTNSYHRVHYEVRKEAEYPRGRPAKGKAHTPTGYEYIQTSRRRKKSVLYITS